MHSSTSSDQHRSRLRRPAPISLTSEGDMVEATISIIGKDTGEQGLETTFKHIRKRAMSAWGAACLLQQQGDLAVLETVCDDCAWIARLAEMHRLDLMRERVGEEKACELSAVARLQRMWPRIKYIARYIAKGE